MVPLLYKQLYFDWKVRINKMKSIVCILFVLFLVPGIVLAQGELVTDKAEQGTLISWDKLVDTYKVKERTLGNKLVMRIVGNDPVWGTGYMLSAEKRGLVKKVLRVDNPYFKKSGGIMGVRGVKGSLSLENNAPYPEFYSVLGIGTSVILPDQWIKIFGIEIKGGSIQIEKAGIVVTQSEIKQYDRVKH